jgi:hypothetical protein
MMQDFQDAPYINDLKPANAVIFHRGWPVRTTAANRLVLTAVEQPEVRGFQWSLTMCRAGEGVDAVELPPDEAPLGDESGRRAAASEPDLL